MDVKKVTQPLVCSAGNLSTVIEPANVFIRSTSLSVFEI